MGFVWVIILISSCCTDITHFAEGTKRALSISRLYLFRIMPILKLNPNKIPNEELTQE